MATSIPYLEITDGVSSVKLMDNLATTPALIAAMPYRLSYGDWAPKIATRNNDPLGLPYSPVLEEMVIDIKGTTPDVALTRLQTLNNLLDQAERWYNNEQVLPVFVRYQPKGSAKSTYMQDVIIGRGIGNQSDNAMLTLPQDFNSVGDFYYFVGIRVAFWRRNGVWLCESETLTASTVAQSVAGTVTWSDFATVLSPIDIEIGVNANAVNNTASGFTLVAHDSRFIAVLAGTAAGSGGANQADAANFPTFTQVRRFSLSTSPLFGLWDTAAIPLKEAEYYAVYAKVRNASASNDAYIHAETNTPAIVQQEVKVLSNGLATVVFLGIFPTRGRTPVNISSGALRIGMRTASGATLLDIDSIAILMLNRASNAIAGSNIVHNTLASTGSVNILNRLLLEPQGEYAINTPPNDILQTYGGSVYNFTGGSGTVKQATILHYFTHPTPFWTLLNNALGAKLTIDYRVTRSKAYLVPE